jgi:hypothetical protein
MKLYSGASAQEKESKENIKRLIRYKNQIILLSGNTRQIFIINSKGGVIEQRIHKAGNGPGESNVILDIGFDE